MGDARTSLGRGNRIDFTGGLGADEEENMREEAWGR